MFHINSVRDVSNLNKNEFVLDETIFYHDYYGKGTYKGFSSKGNIIVYFDSEDKQIEFDYPLVFKTSMSVGKSDETIWYENNMLDKEYKLIELEERSYFDEVVRYLKEKKLENDNILMNEKAGYNNVFNSDYSSRSLYMYRAAESEQSELVDKTNNPYFARFDLVSENGKSKNYIGKNEISNYVLGWQNPLCEPYYRYQFYIGKNKKVRLDLLRNFKIVLGKYFYHDDLYNFNKETWLFCIRFTNSKLYPKSFNICSCNSA